MSRVLGILGGMGPEATALFFTQVVKATPAQRDQEHLRVLMDNNSKIPPRIDFLKGRGEDPRPALLSSLQGLLRQGAGVLAMPCNTAHAFWPQLQEAAGEVPFLHIAEATARALGEAVPGGNVGILATDMTVELGIYDPFVAREGLPLIRPTPEEQTAVSHAIDLLKAMEYHKAETLLLPVAESIKARGAQVLLAGCTELPLVMGERYGGLPVVDSSLALAREAVRVCLAVNGGSEGRN